MLYNILRFLGKIIIKPLYRVDVKGLENIPKGGGYILCANHKSLLDPVFLAIVWPYKISFMGKKELFDKKILGPIIKSLGAFPVDRKGRDLASLKHSISLLKEDKILGIFPEGTRTKDISRDNMKEGVSFIALKAKKYILPVEIISTFKPFKKSLVIIKKPVDINNFTNLKSREAMALITDGIFEGIYGKQISQQRNDINANNYS